MTRKYFSFKGTELQDLFDRSPKDLDTLKELLEELKHRKAQKMIKLRKEVEDRISTVQAPTPKNSPPTQPRSSTHQKKGQPKNDSHKNQKQTNTAEHRSSENTKKKGDSSKKPSPEANSRSNSHYPPSANDHELGYIRPCGHVDGAPKAFQHKMSDSVSFSFDTKAALSTRYAEVLGALLVEIRKKGTGMKAYELLNGRPVTLDGTKLGLKFEIEGETDVFEGAQVRLDVNGAHHDAHIVSANSKSILLSVENQLGNIARCTMRIDSTALLKALQERLEKLEQEPNNFNFNLAKEVIFNSGSPSQNTPSFIDSSLNHKQCSAVASILHNSTTYLWGPPGTGKTQTLAVAIRELFDQEKRVLICSNTNQAVDQVLLKICKTLGEKHPALTSGSIVRVGQVQHQELSNSWSEYVTLEGIVARKSKHLVQQLSTLNREIELLDNKDKANDELIINFNNLDALSKQLTDLDKNHRKSEKDYTESKTSESKLQSALNKHTTELDERNKAGAIKKLLSRSADSIQRDINSTKSKLTTQQKTSERLMLALSKSDYQSNRTKLEQQRSKLANQLSKFNRKSVEGSHKAIQEQIRDKANERSKIQQEIENIEKTVLDESSIIGTTVTKLYLSSSLFSDFDAVIIDEASMVQLPAIYYAAGRSKEKVVISGDFRQLSPIVTSNEQAILDEIGNDIFKVAGTQEAFENRTTLKRTTLLDTQYRMPKNVCNLISPRMYNGQLKTGTNKDPIQLPEPFNSNMVLIDTSSITPFVNTNGGSRYNLLNTIIARNICIHLGAQNFKGSIGICTPYAAQKDLLGKVLKSEGLEKTVESGTVHRYQGDEKDGIIFDIPDSYGEHYVGGFAQAELASDSGSKLFNVAVSRSKGSFIVIANLDYLDKKLPANAFLREILHTISKQGQVLDANEILTFRPLTESDFKYGQAANLNLESLQDGVFTQAEFDPVFLSDASQAKKSIVIYSGFITPTRIAHYENFFRSCIAKGIAIRCVTRPPSRNGSMSVADSKAALDKLEQIGCVVDTRWDIHEKLVLIDDEVVWIGSLNPLSHTSSTSEIMIRTTGQDVALQLASFMSINDTIKPDQAKGHSCKKENPNCPECSSRSVYRKGRFGGFWECESTCGWKENINKHTSSTNKPSKLKGEAPACPKCGGKMTSRQGRHGPFWGCSQFPKCKGIVNAK